MKLKTQILFSGAIALLLSCGISKPADAQQTPVNPSNRSDLGVDLKLNAQQRKVIEAIGGFALEQMEEMISNGFDPQKLNRADTAQKSATIRQLFSSFRLDDQQKAALTTILRGAREQIKRQMETDR